MEQHLRRCHWCADEVDALRQTIALVATLEEVEVPAAFHVQLHNRLVALGPPVKAGRTAVASGTRQSDFRRWAVPAAAAAALVIGMAGVSRLNQSLPIKPGIIGEAVPTPNTSETVSPTEVVTITNPGDNKTGGSETTTPPHSSGEGEKPTVNPSDTKPTETTAPQPEAVVDNSTGSNPTPPGDTSSDSGVRTASFLETVTAPATYASVQRPVAQVEAAVADVSQAALTLGARFPGLHTQRTDAETGAIVMQITVPVEALETELSFVEGLVGAAAQRQSEGLNIDAMTELYRLMTNLDETREFLVGRMAETTNKESLALLERDLAMITAEFERVREDYAKLEALAKTGTIQVTLKPKTAQ
ncbi:MAG: DUF4349 domain-containing protein [Bacillota bacterium]